MTQQARSILEAKSQQEALEEGEVLRHVGGRLGKARRSMGMSQRAVAERAGIGRAALSAIERGARHPGIRTLFCLADILRQPVGALFGDSDPRVDAAPPGKSEISDLLDAFEEIEGEGAKAEILHLVLEVRRSKTKTLQ
jgi:transcriptional regulator with XRE-family HTH domain